MKTYQEFDGNDAGYYRWLEQHPHGFVINTHRSPSADYMVLHRARCSHISQPIHEVKPGGFTERAYIKICAGDIDALRDWVRAHGRNDGSFSSECQQCKPTLPS